MSERKDKENAKTTINGIEPSSCSSNPTADKFGKTFAFCVICLVSLAGNTVIGITIVCKTKTMRKPINYLIVNIAMSDLLFSIFVILPEMQLRYLKSIHSHVQQPCKFIGTKESVYITKELNSHRIGLVRQHGRRFIVLEHQYSCHDVMYIRSIDSWLIGGPLGQAFYVSWFTSYQPSPLLYLFKAWF